MSDKALGEKIHAWRIERQMPQKHLAEYLGITRQRLWVWETQGVPKGMTTIVTLAMRYVELQLQWLAHGIRF